MGNLPQGPEYFIDPYTGKPTREKPNPLKIMLIAVFGMAVLGGIAFVGISWGLSRLTANLYQKAFKIIHSCPPASDRIGENIEKSPWSLPKGRVKLNDSTGDATWSMNISGEKGEALLSFKAESENGDWSFSKITLDHQGERFDLNECAQKFAEHSARNPKGAEASSKGSAHGPYKPERIPAGELKSVNEFRNDLNWVKHPLRI